MWPSEPAHRCFLCISKMGGGGRGGYPSGEFEGETKNLDLLKPTWNKTYFPAVVAPL